MDVSKADTERFLPLTPAVFHIMLALAGEERHGYAIMQEVEKLTNGQVRLGPGTLYRSLQRMLVDGLTVERTDDPSLGAEDERRRTYQLTDLGLRVAKAEAERLAGLVDAARSRRLLPPLDNDMHQDRDLPGRISRARSPRSRDRGGSQDA